MAVASRVSIRAVRRGGQYVAENVMPLAEPLTALEAFFAEHHRCWQSPGGGLAADNDGIHVWLRCSCGTGTVLRLAPAQPSK